MSINCIDLLSSDDEVEIIDTTFSKVAKQPSGNSHQTLLKNSLEKLTRNSHIDVTINLENSSDIPRPKTVIKDETSNPLLTNQLSQNVGKNGLVNSPHKKPSTNKGNDCNNLMCKPSTPEIVIIDDDMPPSPKNEEPIKARAQVNFFGPQSVPHSSKENRVTDPLSTNSRPQKKPVTANSPIINSPSLFGNKDNNISKLSPTAMEQARNGNRTFNILNAFVEQNMKNTLQTDVVYVIDDDDDEASDVEIENAKTQPKIENNIETNYSQSGISCLSATEKVVIALREKIQEAIKNTQQGFNYIRNEQTGNIKNLKPLEIKKATKPVQSKKRLSDEIISQNILGSSDIRVTRSSLSSIASDSQQSTSKSADDKPSVLGLRNQPMNKYSIENMFSGLVKICNKIFPDDGLETKLWKTFREASEKVLRSEEFLNALKTALSSAENSKIETLDEKLIVQRDVKEVLRIMKRHPSIVDKKVKRLTKMLHIVRSRIRKLEEAEVTSDEDESEENAYILLDRYRTRATKIYKKICELQGEPSHADRLVLQKFTFTGNSGYHKIEQALQKFYQKTRSFPDFMDVKMLVEKTIKKENMDIPPHKIQTIAQSLFIEFGNRLQRMRCFDDYRIMNEYLDDSKDPALNNEQLFKSLSQWDSSKKIREAENKIFEEYTCKQVEQKGRGDNKSEESDGAIDGTDEDDSAENKQNDLHFSDTDEELINSEVKRDRKEDLSDEDDCPPNKKQRHE